MEQGPLTNSDIVPVLPIETRKRHLPTLITRLVLGVRTTSPWRGRADVVLVDDIYGPTKVSASDFKIAQEVADKIIMEFGVQRIIPHHQVLVIRDRAQDILEAMTDERAGKKGIIMLKDQGGCGHWRMVLPATHMDRSGIYIDITGGSVDFDHLLEYDTICVQRVHNWDSQSVLERLKKAGKRIIYDIDDDLFSIPESNPASKAMGRGEQMAALACMKLADVVVVTTTALQERLGQLLGRDPVVIPNAIDLDDGWLPTEKTGSPDGMQRIFWQGSNTHDEDWGECFAAVSQVMKERNNVRLVLLGFLPTMVRKSMDVPWFKNRVEHLGPMAPEAYFRLIKHIRGEVGLAPICQNPFNEAKSPIKWIENSMIGMPTVASDVRAYSEVIEHESNGFLCSTIEEWKNAIDTCLDNEKTRKRLTGNSRQKIRQEFDIKSVSKTWKQLLVGA